MSLEGVRVPLSRRRVGDIARTVLRGARVRHAFLSVTFVTNRAIRALNRRHLGRDAATDVIAFGYRQPGRPPALVGDIYIAPEVAHAFARRHGVPVREEVARLVVHGTLHVLGYDHPKGPARTRSPMWRRQERLVRRLR